MVRAEIMTVSEIVKKLNETSGTKEHAELLRTLTDKQIEEVVNYKYPSLPISQKAIVFEGYKKMQTL